MVEVKSPIEIELTAHIPAIFSQLIQSVDPLAMVREQLSNIFAQEVGATHVDIVHFCDPTYGYSFVFADDGCGMNYTGNLGKPGRLDRYIHFGFSGIAGLTVDEFSWKGLGSKLAYNCRRLKIETWSGGTVGYHVVVDEPRTKLTHTPPCVPRPLLYEVPADGFAHKGTKIEVLGYNLGKTAYDFNQLKNYLLYRTVVGYTKIGARNLPTVKLKVDATEEIIKPGFPYIKKDLKEDWRTVEIEPPVMVSEKTSEGTNVRVMLKGGFTFDTPKFNLSPRRLNTGVILSVKGIPYFPLDFNAFRGGLALLSRFCCLVTECDEMDRSLNIDRSWYNQDSVSQAFEQCLTKAFHELTKLDGYKTLIYNQEVEHKKKAGDNLEHRKQSLESKAQRFVFVDGVPNYIHKEPDNEFDTLAVLWKLEGMGKVPLKFFRTIEHTSLEGIDIIGEMKEGALDEVQKYAAIEAEYVFERFMLHRHSPAQTRYVFCWEIANHDELDTTSLPFKFRKIIDDKVIEVYEISRFPGIQTRKLS